jgi:hypothetical protein
VYDKEEPAKKSGAMGKRDDSMNEMTKRATVENGFCAKFSIQIFAFRSRERLVSSLTMRVASF